MNDRRLLLTVLGTTALTTLGPLLLDNPALANPQGATVVGGSVGIVQASPSQLTVNQASQNAVINWQSFSVGAKEQTTFNQPSSSALAVNRVVGADPSAIAGRITANGRVVLTNPNGIVVSQGARIDAGSFIATTSGITNANAMAGRLAFTEGSTSPTAAVVNHGEITVRQGGLAALVAPGVANDGVIAARLGKVALASGQTFTIDLNGDRLVSFAVDGQVLKQVAAPDGTPLTAAVSNAGKIIAHGGMVEISVDAAKGVVDQAINMTGIVEANSARQVGGTIVLDGGSNGVVNITGTLAATGSGSGESGGRISVTGDSVMQTGTLDASGNVAGGSVSVTANRLINQGRIAADSATGNGGTIAIATEASYIDTEGSTLSAQSLGSGTGGSISVIGGSTGTLFASGTESVRSANGIGGSVAMTAGSVDLVGTTIDASGATGGGTIEIGGGLHGQGSLADANSTLVIPGTTLDADARSSGNGGSVVVWSNGNTTFAGTITARGGALSGNGGSAEVSSKNDLTYAGTTDLTAANGATGTLLLDPANIIIDDATGGIAAYQLIDPDPTPAGSFGEQILTLANGNIVVTNPTDGFAGSNSGAVYVYNGQTAQLISALTGSQANDEVGGSVTVLNNGNFAVLSPNWVNGTAANAGAITWANANTGVSGIVSAANSLVGSNPGDFVGGNGLTALNSGNYLVGTYGWNGGAGAVTFVNATTPTVGVISAANSLVGSNPDDYVGNFGEGITLLGDGNYVVSSPYWGNGGNLGLGIGAVTFGSGTTGVSGAVSAANSIVGSAQGDQIGGNGITPLGNGNYVIDSPNWGSAGTSGLGKGAVTWVNGTTGQDAAGNVGDTVSAANSLVGSAQGDQVGSGGLDGGIIEVGDSNYVVVSPNWSNPNGFFGAATRAGAVTWADGTTGITGTINAANSLVGDFNGDNVGSGGVTVLTNGNYVVVSATYQGPPDAVGAVTWGNGNGGLSTFGDILDSDSTLTGSFSGDNVGSGGVIALSNGNFVVLSPDWNSNTGAVTWGDGTSGITGAPAVSAANSLVGQESGDNVGSGGIVSVGNSNYVVLSPSYNTFGMATNAGAVTWVNGSNGHDFAGNVGDAVSATNSLVGPYPQDQIGSGGVTELYNGNYVVISPNWQGFGNTGAGYGAVTWGDGNVGVVGYVLSNNSLVGGSYGDQVGSGGIQQLNSGNYVVVSPNWQSFGSAGLGYGAVTWINGYTGQDFAGNVGDIVSAANSVVGSQLGDQVGSNGVTALYNGNYVIDSPNWGRNNSVGLGLGAVTWGDGYNGTIGTVSAANSLVGSTVGDGVGSGGITQLYVTDNYVVSSPNWQNGGLSSAGAVTWVNGSTGQDLQGNVGDTVSAANSLVGSHAGDQIGYDGLYSQTIYQLGNGNFLVQSSNWNSGAGAVTFVNGNTGLAGVVSATNSLVGSNPGDSVGSGSIYEVGDGNYTVVTYTWNSYAGAVTWGSGTTGVSGVISATNSLVGDTVDDEVGAYGITNLSNGNYVVVSPYWHTDTGAVTWADGNTGITGVVSAANSLVGSNPGDFVGSSGIVELYNGANYLVLSPNWNSGAGAISIGDIASGVTGTVSSANSLLGDAPGAGLTFDYYDYTNQAFIAYAHLGTYDCDCDPVPPTGGEVLLGLTDLNQLTFDRAEGGTVTISSAVLAQALQTADITLQANNDITFDNGVSVTSGGHDLTLEAGRSIAIAAGSALTFDGNFTATANSADPNVIAAERQPGAGSITMGAGSSIDTPNGAVSLTVDGGGTPGGVTLGNINALTVFAQSGAGGDITLNGVIDPADGEDTLVLASGGNFINNAGAGALSAPSGRWLVYSQNPDSDVIGGLVPGFIQYGATYGVTPVADATDNGFLYSAVPVVTITGVTKTYDATTTATLTPGDFTTTGALGGDTVVLSAASGTYTTANAGSGIAVDFTGLSVSASNGTTPIYGYQAVVASPDTIGTILPAPLTVSVDDTSRTYGAANPRFTVTASGLQGSDTVADLGLNITTTAVSASTGIGASGVPYGAVSAGSPVGTYPITAMVIDPNYRIVSNPGTLTITPATLTVTVANTSRDFGEPNPTFQALLTGLLGTDSAGSVGLTTTTTALGGSNGSGGSAPGAYPITASITNANYTINLIPGTLTILSGSGTTPPPPPLTPDQLAALLASTSSTPPSIIAMLLNTPLNQLTRAQREEIAILVNQALGSPGVDTDPFELPTWRLKYLAGYEGGAAPWSFPNGAVAQYPDAYQYVDAYLRALLQPTVSSSP